MTIHNKSVTHGLGFTPVSGNPFTEQGMSHTLAMVQAAGKLWPDQVVTTALELLQTVYPTHPGIISQDVEITQTVVSDSGRVLTASMTLSDTLAMNFYALRPVSATMGITHYMSGYKIQSPWSYNTPAGSSDFTIGLVSAALLETLTLDELEELTLDELEALDL